MAVCQPAVEGSDDLLLRQGLGEGGAGPELNWVLSVQNTPALEDKHSMKRQKVKGHLCILYCLFADVMTVWVLESRGRNS